MEKTDASSSNRPDSFVAFIRESHDEMRVAGSGGGALMEKLRGHPLFTLIRI